MLGGIAWLISFLLKKFNIFDEKLNTLSSKLLEKVSLLICRLRRCNLISSNNSTLINTKLVSALEKVAQKLDSTK